MPRKRGKKRFRIWDIASTKKDAEKIAKDLEKIGFDTRIYDKPAGIPFIISRRKWKIYARKREHDRWITMEPS